MGAETACRRLNSETVIPVFPGWKGLFSQSEDRGGEATGARLDWIVRPGDGIRAANFELEVCADATCYVESRRVAGRGCALAAERLGTGRR